jgi:outer membrane immunogenic protein
MKKRMCLFLFAAVLISIFLFTGVSSAQKSGTYDWSGFYLGLNAGAGGMNVKEKNTVNNSSYGDMLPGESFHRRAGGFIGGAQFGFNFQVKKFVFGAEVMTEGTGLKARYTSTFGAADDDFKARINFLLNVIGRIGFSLDKFLFYGKGGYAGALTSLSVEDTVPINTGKGTSRPWLSGWTAGVGAEYAITKHLIAGIEYNYTDLAKTSVNWGDSSGAYKFDAKIKDFHRGLVKLSYKFDW